MAFIRGIKVVKKPADYKKSAGFFAFFCSRIGLL